MLLENRLRQLSADKEKEKMFSQLNILKDQAESKLNTVFGHFPHFSKHDITHSQVIATHIGNLLGEDRVNKLSYSDLFIMLLSFYYHDIGMALEYEEIYKYFHEPTFQTTLDIYIKDPTSDLHDVACRLHEFSIAGTNNYETAIDVYNDVILIIEDTYRTNHAQRSADEVMKDAFLKEFLHERCQKILSDICAIHQKSIAAISDLQTKENGFFGDYFHPRLIGAMLCLGDLLDLDTDRFDEIYLRSSSPMPSTSKLHLAKHKSVYHFLVDEGNIEIGADMNQIEAYRVMRKWINWIQETCDYLALHWSEIAPENFGNAPKITKCELLLNGNTKWLEFSHTRYEVSDKRMFEILKGSGIYKNKFVCIREIIQNAVDATLLRLFEDETLSGDEDSILNQVTALHWENYKITGEIRVLNDTQISVKLRDRGIGISNDDIKKIAKVSNTDGAKRKELISKMPVWLRPSGAFGMGLQSIFLLANEFEIITKTSDETAKKIVFQNASNSDGYIIVEDYGEAFSQGTEISFVIEGTNLSAVELGCSNYHYQQKRLSMYMLNKIYNAYTNQSKSNYPFYLARRKTTDYIPAEIKYIAPSQEDILLLHDPLFSAEKMDSVKVDYRSIEIEKFSAKLNCFITARIHLIGQHQSEQDHVYGELQNVGWQYYRNVLFYRNNFVQENMLHEPYSCKFPIISYMDWRINLLDATADEVLKIDRNSINEDYAGVFQQRLNDALELAAKTAIDYMIEKSSKDEQENLDDTLLILYQLAVQLNYHMYDFQKMFQEILDKITITNYYLWPYSKESEQIREIKISELQKKKLYFVVDKAEHVPPDIQSRTLLSTDCFDLMGKHSTHLLSHRATHIFLGKVDNVFVKAIEAVPFECNTSDRLYRIDDLFFIENLIQMINLRLRVLPATEGYEILATPIGLSIDELKYNLRDNQYYVEMPFGEHLDQMRETLRSTGWISNALGKYEKLILHSGLFHENIRYIANINMEHPPKIQVKYEMLIHKCLELLGNEIYKEFNQNVINKMDAAERTYSFRERDPIEINPYITFKNARL